MVEHATLCSFGNSSRADGDLYPGNAILYKAYFWKGATMGHPKIAILKFASDGYGMFSQLLFEYLIKIKG